MYIAILSENDENLTPPEEKRLIPAIDYIQTHYSEKLTNKQLADIMGLSEMHLLRLFKSVYGKTPKEFVTDFRVEVAKKKLIRHPKRQLNKLPPNADFPIPPHLHRLFISMRI